MLRHAIHLSLKLARTDGSPEVICDKLRQVQILGDLLFNFLPRDRRIERRFRSRIVLRPNPMTPVNFFNGPLIRYALC
jgi:hypothetical protein